LFFMLTATPEIYPLSLHDALPILGVSFMIVYTIVSPVMGWMGDRYSRKMLLASGVGLWSLATVGTAFSADFYHMFFWRALLGLRSEEHTSELQSLTNLVCRLLLEK